MKDFWDCVETMAGFTYAMFLASLMIILIFEQDMSCMTICVPVVLLIASITAFMILYKHSKK